MSRVMSRKEIQNFQADPWPKSRKETIKQAKEKMEETGNWNAWQHHGRRWPVGCVALEITQRCNLNCTLCYLSKEAQSIKDLPLEEVFRRIQGIHDHYGPTTNVQITGGDPTLRDTEELLAIVREVHRLGMRAALMTNGIKLNRNLLEKLQEAGLYDVVYHVDTTQNIKGFRTEVELNQIRQKYIDMARGLPIAVMFNTSVHQGNFHEIPDLIRFFKKNADVIRLVSFQLQADTGRSVLGTRTQQINSDSAWKLIEEGAGITINHQSSQIGHPQCNRAGVCLESNGNLFDFFGNSELIASLLKATETLIWERRKPHKAVKLFSQWVLANPQFLPLVLKEVGLKLWEMKSDLIQARGKVNKLTIFIHNFMDACALEPERVKSCVFKAISKDGPICMCVYNAKREQFTPPDRIGL